MVHTRARTGANAGMNRISARCKGRSVDPGAGRDTWVWPRVAFSLGERYGTWVWRVAGVLPGFARARSRLAAHAERSAALAASAGCSERTVALIRQRSTREDQRFADLLRLADEAN